MNEQLKCDAAISAIVFGLLSSLLLRGQLGWLGATAAGVGFGVILATGMDFLKNYMENTDKPPVSQDEER